MMFFKLIKIRDNTIDSYKIFNIRLEIAEGITEDDLKTTNFTEEYVGNNKVETYIYSKKSMYQNLYNTVKYSNKSDMSKRVQMQYSSLLINFSRDYPEVLI